MVCYETFDGSFNDINCKEINLAEQSISETIIISDNAYNQEAPNVYWSGDSYLIAWEDTRNSTSNSPEKDIYFQEYQNNNSTFTAGGEALCTYSQTQKKHVISTLFFPFGLFLLKGAQWHSPDFPHEYKSLL